MITLLRADLVRLRTLRSHHVVVAVLLGLVGLITWGSMSDAGSGGFDSPSELREPVTASVGILVAVVLALFAATRVAGEYRYGTISQRLLAAPRRTRLLIATLTTHAVLGLVLGAAALGLAAGIAAPMLADKDLSMELSLPIVASTLLATVAFSVIGVSCGFIFRSQPVAVMVIAGTFVAEKLVGMFIGDAAAYLPYGLLTPLLRLEGGTIGAGAAAISLVTITTAVTGLAFVLFNRRDVTP
jgi:ABC-type transport system involved in multi-copper enzyme maturation permease subunit